MSWTLFLLGDQNSKFSRRTVTMRSDGGEDEDEDEGELFNLTVSDLEKLVNALFAKKHIGHIFPLK